MYECSYREPHGGIETTVYSSVESLLHTNAHTTFRIKARTFWYWFRYLHTKIASAGTKMYENQFSYHVLVRTVYSAVQYLRSR